MEHFWGAGLAWPVPAVSESVFFFSKSFKKLFILKLPCGGPLRLAGLGWGGLALPSPKVCFSFRSLLKIVHFEASVWGGPFGCLGWPGLAWPGLLSLEEDKEQEDAEKEEEEENA